jgi:MOB kinase activator 1
MSPINRSLPAQQLPSSNELEQYNDSSDTHSETSSNPIDSSKYDLKGAVHKQVCMLFGTISKDCKCPEMTAGQHKYLWSSGPERRSVELCASDYITLSLDWIQEQLSDENIFPSMSIEKDFPDNFQLVCKVIARRLFRVFAHVYHHHLTHVRKAKIEAHMNTSLKHFIYFVREFSLIETKEWEPLQDYVDKLDILSIENIRITN